MAMLELMMSSPFNIKNGTETLPATARKKDAAGATVAVL